MLCDVCQKNKASVYLTQIVDGKMQKVNLCEPCSQEKGVTDPTGFALADLLLGMGSTEKVASAHGESCDFCGFTQMDLKKTGRLGCSECYQVFPDSVKVLIKAMHKSFHHVGKVPQAYWKSMALGERLEELRRDLAEAVEDEDYERAARLRDEIKKVREHAPADQVRESEGDEP